MNKSESIKNIAGALLAAQKTMGDATKGSKNPFFKSSYADLNSIREVAIPALNAQGVTVLQPTDAAAGLVETVLLHTSGEWISGTTKIVNTKGDAQGEGSGVSYARRYGLQSLLNIGAVDDDGEAAVGRKPANAITAVLDTISKEVENDTKKPQTSTKVPKIDTVRTGPTGGDKSGSGDSGPSAAPANGKPSQGTSRFPDVKKANKEVIAEAFKKLEAEKKVTKETFKTKYLSGAGLSTINDTQAAIAVIKIQTDFPGVI